MKRKNLSIFLSLLTLISLVSVGFASWVISAGDQDEITGNVLVETVTDERIVISEVEFDDPVGKGYICLTAPEDAHDTGWLHAGSHVLENLTASFSFKVDFTDESKNVITEGDAKNVELTVTWDDDTTTLLNSAVTLKLIKKVPEFNIVNNSGSYTVSFSFEWGETFGEKNPFEFYNSLNINDGYYKDNIDEIKYYQKGDKYFTDFECTLEATPTEEDLKDLNFVSWGDDALSKLDKLFDLFGENDDENGAKSVNYTVIIIAEHYTAAE